jgi:hypothetical protein
MISSGKEAREASFFHIRKEDQNVRDFREESETTMHMGEDA